MLINDRNKSIKIKSIIKEINSLNMKYKKDMLNPFSKTKLIKSKEKQTKISSPIKYYNKTLCIDNKKTKSLSNNFLNSSLEVTCYNKTDRTKVKSPSTFYVLNNNKKRNEENSFYNKKANIFMNNNIYNELRERKLEEEKNKHNFLCLLVISNEEYLNSHTEIMKLTDIFNELDLIRLKSINNLKFTVKFILDCFLFFIGYVYFDCK
jgi:hypothetical protein